VKHSMPIFKASELRGLRDEFAKSPAKFAGKYAKEKPWATDPGLYADAEGFHVPPELPGMMLEVRDDHQRCEIVHSLMPLAPRAASNPLFWARAAHVEFWDYMRAVWPVEHSLRALKDAEKSGSKQEKRNRLRALRRFIGTRYFVPTMSSGMIIKHAVARLWWFGHMALREDGVYRNAWVLVYLKDIVERSYGRNPTVVRAVVDFIAVHNGQFEFDISKSHWRPILKELNRVGGNSLVPAMSEREVWTFMEEAFEIICSEREDRVRIVRFDEAGEMMDSGLIPHDRPARWNEDLEPVGGGGPRPIRRPAPEKIDPNAVLRSYPIERPQPMPAPAGKRDLRDTGGFMAEMDALRRHRNP
jgi:hypothetical protein